MKVKELFLCNPYTLEVCIFFNATNFSTLDYIYLENANITLVLRENLNYSKDEFVKSLQKSNKKYGKNIQLTFEELLEKDILSFRVVHNTLCLNINMEEL